jgi:putative flippase GtrA
MISVKRYDEYFDNEQLAQEFIDSFDNIIKESDSNDEEEYQSILKKFSKDLKLNFALIGTFATGISTFVPIVDKLMNNMNISTEMDIEKVVLLTICSLTIIYLEEKKYKNSKEEQQLINDSKSMLEELKMMGIGNGIVKMVVKSFNSIKNIFNLIGKHIGAVVGGIVDMFAYTSLMIPVMNGISFIVGKYDLTPETLIQNLVGIAAGVGTIIAKHGVVHILGKLKGKWPFKKKEILDEIETPVIQKFSLYNKEDEDHGEPINEQ